MISRLTFRTLAMEAAMPPETIEMSCEEVRDLLQRDEEIVLLDCREAGEWDLVHLEPARWLPMSELADRIDELEGAKSQTVIVYCHHGVRSLRVANWLRQQGFPLAVSMSGGIDAWAERIDDSLPRY